VTRARVAAATAALLSALVLQATVVGPLTMPLPVSLPALLVAAIALVDGPGTGLACGFATGLVADLGSEHPAGVLALCWLGVGLGCGLCAVPGSTLRRDAVIAAAACGAASIAATLVLAVAGVDRTSVDAAVRYGILASAVNALIAFAVLAVTRVFLRSETLRAPRPVLLLDEENR
jgi:hypothetical protein